MTWLDEMRAEHQAQRAEMREFMQDVEMRLTERITDVKSDLMKWSFVFWCGAVAAIAALAGVLRSP